MKNKRHRHISKVPHGYLIRLQRQNKVVYNAFRTTFKEAVKARDEAVKQFPLIRQVSVAKEGHFTDLRSSNKSGVTGVHHRPSKVPGHGSWVATWIENKKNRNRQFGYLDGGSGAAFYLAVKWRKKMVSQHQKKVIRGKAKRKAPGKG